jgi:hypothetical protein
MGGAPAPPPSIQNFRAAEQAFLTFEQTYSVDLGAVLFAKDASGHVNPSANQAAFNADVAAALDVLDASLEAIVADLQGGSTLASNIKSTLVGPGPQTVQSQLQATTPTTTAASTTTSSPSSSSGSARLAQLKSSAIIDAVAEQITLEILESIPATTLVGATSTSTATADDFGDSPVSDTLATSVSDTLATPVSRTIAGPFSHRRWS